ncbi:MAG: helix-turn-helix transcriptional regulator [Deltaproteobacteria bacterium]|nr:helix-turn-helix transcriptional regulator [Deltaproteobacteria bacterium]
MKTQLPQKAINEIMMILRKYRIKYYNPRVIAEVLGRSQRSRISEPKDVDLSRFLEIKVKPNELIQEQRKREGLTLAQLSKLAKIAIPNLSAIENGKRSLGIATAKKIAKALKINYKTLV